jgi:hypothetical protein
MRLFTYLYPNQAIEFSNYKDQDQSNPIHHAEKFYQLDRNCLIERKGYSVLQKLIACDRDRLKQTQFKNALKIEIDKNRSLKISSDEEAFLANDHDEDFGAEEIKKLWSCTENELKMKLINVEDFHNRDCSIGKGFLEPGNEMDF